MSFIGHRSINSREPKHVRKQLSDRDGTFIVEPPLNSQQTLITLTHCFVHRVAIPVKVGVSIVHPSDQYVRKTGTELARQNMKMVDFEVSALERKNEFTVVSLESQCGMKLRLTYKPDKVHPYVSFFEYKGFYYY